MKYIEKQIAFEEYVCLREQLGLLTFARAFVEKSLNQTVYAVAAYDNENLVGYARLIDNGCYYTLADMLVLSNECENKLLDCCEMYVHNNVVKPGYINVTVSEDGCDVYLKRGYVVVNTLGNKCSLQKEM